MKFEVKTVPDLLVDVRGNQSELARRLNVNRGTLRKYLYDKDAKFHAIVNGVFMSTTAESSKGCYANFPTLRGQIGNQTSEQRKRNYTNDRRDLETKLCETCGLTFTGHYLRVVCQSCLTNEDTNAFKKRLKIYGIKLNPVRY